MLCTECDQAVPSHLRDCIVCGASADYPNVRAANTPEERDALASRLDAARTSAERRACIATVDAFGEEVRQSSVAIIARSLTQINHWVSEDRNLYNSYQQQVSSAARVPEENVFDRSRRSFEEMIFPNYSEHINFAALSLGVVGAQAFGGYSVVLKTDAIKIRATIFEENPYNFLRKHQILVGDAVPVGFRSTWADRHKLAVSKLHSNIEADTTADGFPAILIRQGATTASVDYVEVNIFGPLHRKAIELVAGPKPSKGAESVIARSISGKLSEVGARLELY